jgi:hypothetical protein
MMPTMPLLDYRPMSEAIENDPTESTVAGHSDLLGAGVARAYHEDTFNYLLALEKRRCEVSKKPFLLMLVDFKRHSSIDSLIDSATAEKVFWALTNSLRETDFVGWYRKGRVAGAVLIQHGDTDEFDASEAVRRRVGTALEKQLAPETLSFQLRIHQVRPASFVVQGDA